MIKIGMVRQMGRSMFLGDGAAASINFWDPIDALDLERPNLV